MRYALILLVALLVTACGQEPAQEAQIPPRPLLLCPLGPAPISDGYSTGTSTGAPLFLIKITKNFAGLVLLAFRSTT